MIKVLMPCIISLLKGGGSAAIASTQLKSSVSQAGARPHGVSSVAAGSEGQSNIVALNLRPLIAHGILGRWGVALLSGMTDDCTARRAAVPSKFVAVLRFVTGPTWLIQNFTTFSF